MAENNQLSDETKNNSTDTSSTDASSAVIGNHENAVVPHKISNHDKLVQTMVMVDGEWINVNDTNDQANMKEDMHKVNKKVVEAQKGIVEAKNTADSAVKYADSAVSASKVNSDAIVAQREAISEAKSTMDSAAASIRADVATVQSEVNTAKTANETEFKSIRDDLKMANSSIATVKDHLGNVSSELDTYAKSAATQGHDITIIQQKQGQFEVDYAGTKGDVNQIKANIKGLSENLKNSEGDVASLQATAKELQSSMSDAEGNISNLQVTAKSYDKIFEDHLGRLSKVEQTASTLTNELSDEQGHLNRVEQTAQGTQQTVANQQGQINNIKTDAAGIHETLTGQGNQIANINVTLNGLSSKYEGVSGDLGKLKSSTMQNRGTVNAPDFNTLTQAGYYTVTNLISGKNYPISNWGTLEVSGQTVDGNGRLNQKYVGDNDSGTYTRQYNANTKSWTAWIKTANQNDVTALSNRITTNSTQITQNQQAIALKADQATVNNLSGEVSQAQAQLKVQAGQISSKVTSTDVNNIVDNKGYATTSTVQSLITQKAGTISESITNLEQTVKQGAENNVQLVRKSEFEDGSKGSWDAQMIVSATNPAPPAELGQSGMKVLQSNTRDAYEVDVWYSVKPGEKFDVDFWCAPSNVYNSNFGLTFVDKNKGNTNWLGIVTDHSGAWKHYTGTITAPTNAAFARPWFQIDKDSSNTSNTAWLAKPSIRRQNATTVAAIQQITASIDGLQSTVASKADRSQITQLSNVIQSKVSSTDFNNLRKAVDLQTLESADANNLKTNGHYFVHNLANNPVGGWVYVDVTGNGNDRIRQDVYQDIGNKHKYRRWFGTYWTGWSTGAEESEITQLRNDINLRVKSGDLLSQINIAAGHTLIQSNKIYFDADSFVMSPNSKAFIPSAYITNINADKITTGTLDAAKFNVKNFSADNITSGTLNGVVVKTGANDRYFQTSKDNIYWVRKGSMSLVGNDTYLNSANGLNIADEKNIQLTTWGGATVNNDGSITNNSGNSGHPKIVIDFEGKYNPDGIYGSAFGGGPGDSEIAQWVGNKEYTVLTRNQGFTVRLNDGNNKSIFAIQKDNKVGFYVGGGDDGEEIRIAGAGPIKLQGKYIDDGFNDGMTHTLGNLQVDNLHVRKWLGVDQSKNAIVKTSQGPVTINAYETAEYYFGDIGEGQTSADGIAYIGIEKLFNETVNTTIPYHVFITAYGPGNIWVDQREHNRFIVKSDQPNLKFSWEIKAKRKGYEHTRLQNVDDKLNRMAATS